MRVQSHSASRRTTMNKIAEIFTSLDYGPAPEAPMSRWPGSPRMTTSFGHFINGAWTKPGKTFATDNPATGKTARADHRRHRRRCRRRRQSRPRRLPALVGALGLRARQVSLCHRPPDPEAQRASSPCSKPWTTASRSARAATSISRSSPAISTTTPAGPSTSSASSPTTSPMASAARSSRGTSRC